MSQDPSFVMPVPLDRTAIFRDMAPEALIPLAAAMTEATYNAGDVIIQAGTTGDDLLVIAHGTVEVVLDAGTEYEIVVAQLGAGDFVGEMAMLESVDRSATVRATAPSTVFWLSRAQLEELGATAPDQYGVVIQNIARELSKRLRTLGESVAGVLKVNATEPDSTTEVNTFLEGVFIFDGLSRDALCALAVAADEFIYYKGQVVFKEGQFGDRLYIIGDGSVEVVKGLGEQTEAVLATLGVNAVFGEMCLVEGLFRSASVRVCEASLIYSLSNATLMKFARYWPEQHTRIIYNIARELSRRLRALDTSVRSQAHLFL